MICVNPSSANDSSNVWNVNTDGSNNNNNPSNTNGFRPFDCGLFRSSSWNPFEGKTKAVKVCKEIMS